MFLAICENALSISFNFFGVHKGWRQHLWCTTLPGKHWNSEWKEVQHILTDCHLSGASCFTLCVALSPVKSNETSGGCWAAVKASWLEWESAGHSMSASLDESVNKMTNINIHPGDCFVLHNVLLTESKAFFQLYHYISLPTEAVTALHLYFPSPAVLHNPTSHPSTLPLDWYVGWNWQFIENEI